MVRLTNSISFRGADSNGEMYGASSEVSVTANPEWIHRTRQPCLVIQTTMAVSKGRSRVAVCIDSRDFRSLIEAMIAVDGGGTLKAFGECLASGSLK